MASSIVPIIPFKTPKAFQTWLLKHFEDQAGIWLRFYKKDSGVKSITYPEALDVALCYGWIDGQTKKHDEQSWIQKFTPRRKRSLWSKRNVEHFKRLQKEGRMKPSGLKEYEEAEKDGRLKQAYDSPSNMKVPDDFLSSLKKNKRALAFFESLNKSNTYAIAWRLQTAKKPETREKRMKVILQMMRDGKKFH